MSTARLRRETWCGVLGREQTETVTLTSVLKPHFFLHESAFLPRETSESTQETAL